MQYENTKLIIYKDDNVYFILGSEILNLFNCELAETTSEFLKYQINDEIFINSLNKENNIELSRISNIYIKQSSSELYEIFLNNSNQYVSNILCFSIKQKKPYFIKNLESLEKKFILQNLSKFNFDSIEQVDSIDLSMNTGYLVGYWLLRGGFQQIKKHDIEHVSWSGKDENIEVFKNILKNDTYLIKSFKNNLNSILLIDSDYTDFFKFYFKQNKNKEFPVWIYSSDPRFIQGLFYGLISANSYISKDTNDNYYLTIKVINPNLIYNLNQLFEFRMNIYSKIIGKNNYLSFKINSKLYELLLYGVDEKLIDIPEIAEIDPVINKEIKHEHYKLLPWYKCKVTKKEITNPFALELENNNIHMISNGLFTS